MSEGRGGRRFFLPPPFASAAGSRPPARRLLSFVVLRRWPAGHEELGRGRRHHDHRWMTHRKTWLVTPDKFLTADHVQRLREHLELRRRRGRGSGDRKAVRDAAIIEVLLSTGLRVSEVCDLVVGDIFLDTGHVLVRRGKGNRARLVAIPKTLAEYLDEFVLWTSKVRKEVDADGPLFV